MRFALFATATSIIIAGTAIACSSSSSPAADDDAGSPSASSSGDQGTTTSSTSSSSGDQGTTTSSTSTSSGGSSSGSDVLPDAGDGGGSSTSSTSSSTGGTPVDGGAAGTLCNLTSTPEVESNDSVGTATLLATVPGEVCGRLSSAADVDYFTFTLPASAAAGGFSYVQSTNTGLTIEITADGTVAAPGTFPVKPGKVYVIKVTGAPTDYRLTFHL